MSVERAEVSPHGPRPVTAQGEDGAPPGAATGIADVSWERKASALPQNVRELRDGIVAFAAQHGAEAGTQAEMHAFVGRAPGTITVIAESAGPVLTVRVIDDGRGTVPRLDSPGLGLGLATIAQSAASFEIRAGPDGRGTETCLVFEVQDGQRRLQGRLPGQEPRGVSGAPRQANGTRKPAAGDAERKRIEQDIHAGLQQRLTALRIRLALAAERFQANGSTEASAALEGFGDEIGQVLDELRDAAHGIYPTLLTTHGLSAALSAAATHAAQPVTVRVSGVRRCTPAVETAVYFSCLAAMDNAAKHAGQAHVSVDLAGTDHALRFTVCDSGAGFDMSRTADGSGIANMRDRINTVGGLLTIDSTPTLGTRVQGEVPDPWVHEPANPGRL